MLWFQCILDTNSVLCGTQSTQVQNVLFCSHFQIISLVTSKCLSVVNLDYLHYTDSILPSLLNQHRHSQEIESQKLFMHKMQREYYANMSKRAQQNEEIIGYNCRLSKVSLTKTLQLSHCLVSSRYLISTLGIFLLCFLAVPSKGNESFAHRREKKNSWEEFDDFSNPFTMNDNSANPCVPC